MNALWWKDPKIVIAVIAAAASILAAIMAALASLWTARKGRNAAEDLEILKGQLSSDLASENATRAESLEHLKGQLSKDLASENAALAETSAERNARRDYEYEARKRLYSEIEPLLFQLYEALEEAHYRVRSLARTSRINRMDWLNHPGYYLRSTLYKLLVPAVLLRLIQRRMTFIDLRVDNSIRIRYQLLKLYSRSFTDDFEMAALKPSLSYDPNSERRRELRASEPAIYMRQGLVLGDLENICETMIVRNADGRPEVTSFVEFEKLLSKAAENEDLQELLGWFLRFSPNTRPVLARILIAQAVMAQLILSTYDEETTVANLREQLEVIAASKTANASLAWVSGMGCSDLPIVAAYWKERLQWLHSRGSWIESDS
jgi:hypothetical protein